MVAVPVKSSFSEGVFAGRVGLQPVLLCVLPLAGVFGCSTIAMWPSILECIDLFPLPRPPSSILDRMFNFSYKPHLNHFSLGTLDNSRLDAALPSR